MEGGRKGILTKVHQEDRSSCATNAQEEINGKTFGENFRRDGTDLILFLSLI